MSESGSKPLSRWSSSILLFLWLGTAVLSGCSDHPPGGEESRGAPHASAVEEPDKSRDRLAFDGCDLLLISIDTLRADHLPAYGYDRIETPALDALKAESVFFAQARTQAMVTAPSHMTMLTSIYPHVHQVKNLSLEKGKSFTVLPASMETLAEVLKRNGYRTAAFTDGGNVSPLLGFSRGFETFDALNEGISIKIYKAHEYLKERRPDEKLFIFLHTYEVHDYLDAPAFEKIRFNPDAGGMLLAEKKTLQAYDDRIRECDRVLQWFFRKLKDAGRYENMMIVFTSDHGENFYEHGYLGHFQFFRETAHVPLLLRLPGGAQGGRTIDLPVGLVDLMPTVLDLMSIQGPGTMQGRSLVDPIRGRPCDLQPVFGSRLGSPLGYSVYYEGYTLIHDPAFRPPIHSLFETRTDLDEKTDLSAARPGPFKQLDALTRKHIRECERLAEQLGAGDSKKLLDDALIEELKRLGY
ncbi:MAG: sulfatase [Planctomycetota bacterium]